MNVGQGVAAGLAIRGSRRRPAPAARLRARRPVPPLREPVPRAKSGALDRAPPFVLLACAVMLSGVGHVAGLRAMSGTRRGAGAHAKKPDRVQVAVVDKPPPPPPKADAAKAEMPKVMKLARQRPQRKLAPPPDAPVPVKPPREAPPPPNEEAPIDSNLPPMVIPGLALSSTSPTGSFAVGVGNTLYGRAGTVAKAPREVKPYRAREYAAPYALTEEPVLLGNVSPADVRRFYPEEARKAKIEGVVAVKLTLDDDGSVVKVVIVSDPGNGFGAAAVKVARLHRFRPAKVNGRPVATEIPFTIYFELE